MINGHEIAPQIPPTPLVSAQHRLSQAGMSQPMTAEGAAISAYVNGLLHSARLSALVAYTLEEPALNATWTPVERFESLLIRELNAKAQLLESTARDAPRILKVGNA